MGFEYHLVDGVGRAKSNVELRGLNLTVTKVGRSMFKHPRGSVEFEIGHAGSEKLSDSQISWLRTYIRTALGHHIAEDLSAETGHFKYNLSLRPKLIKKKPIVLGRFS